MVAGIALLVAGATLRAAELLPETLQAYERYIRQVDQRFSERIESPKGGWIDGLTGGPGKLTGGGVATRAAAENGMIEIPGGLIHDWQGTIFIPGVSLDEVLAVNQDYDDYDKIHEPVVASRLLERGKGRYRLYMRVKKGTSLVTATLDAWGVAEYRSPREGVAFGRTSVETIMEVEDAGEPDERRLPPGRDSGYLWRAHMYSTFLERDGGVYVELRNIGLSRRLPWAPPPLSWLIAKIVRDVGRASIEEALLETRKAVLASS